MDEEKAMIVKNVEELISQDLGLYFAISEMPKEKQVEFLEIFITAASNILEELKDFQ